MAARAQQENDDAFSEGSDISTGDTSRDEEDIHDINDPEYVPPEPLDRAQWMRDMFTDDEAERDDDDDGGAGFRGFQDDWVTDENGFNPTEKRNFIHKQGVKIDLAADATPGEVFGHIFTDEMWSHLATETNNYARQSRSAQRPNPQSKMGKWKNVDVPEMKTFIGLCIAMGIMRLPVRRDYWRQKKPLFQTTFPRVMSRDRFDAIWKYLHLQDNEAPRDRGDKLWKLRWFMDFLVARFQGLYQVNGFVAVDESMVKFKGRLAFRQYLPLKPVKWGVKVWVMAESSTGYCTNFKVYTGKDAAAVAVREKGLAHEVVMDLARPFYGSHLAVFMDNFYTSPALLAEMRGFGLYGCGTVRANRKGLPKAQELSKTAPMKKHAYKVAQKDDLTFCVWKDTKVLMVLSNYHHPTATGKVNRRREDAVRQSEVTVPACISDYQKYMQGVDLMDQMTGYYQFHHRSKKWWRRVFFFCLSVSCHNAFIAAKSVGAGGKKGYKDWVEDLAAELINPVTVRSPPQTRQTPQTPRPTLGSSPVGSPSASSPASTSASAPGSPASAASHHDFVAKVSENRRCCTVCMVECSGTERRAKRVTSGCQQCQVHVCKSCFGKHYASCQ